jgi:CRISPR-associated protein Csb1
MNKAQIDVAGFDAWLKEDSDIAALVMRQWLEPVEGKEAVIFPPTYPIGDKGDKAGYNIDECKDGSNVCQIDSVGSQANRMEPIFKRQPYKHLVPQVIIVAKAGDRVVHLLDAGHRAADAIVRFFSTLEPQLHEAFRAYKDKGDAEPLGRIAPTSIVFGAWDSRATQVKLPRIVRSVIRAYNVDRLTRSAQYSTIVGELLEDGEVEVTTKGSKAELGLAHVPSTQTHGGVRVRGEIRRDAIVNLAALRAITGSDEKKTEALRRYILGLSLVAITAPQEPNLREGCELVPDAAKGIQWTLVGHDGARREYSLSHEDALAFATEAAKAFGVEEVPPGSFNADDVKMVLKMGEDQIKELLKLLKQGTTIKEAIEQIFKKSKKKSD